MPKAEWHLYYYPFGAPMAGRTHSQEDYRFGFNGKENDNETSTQDYGFRIYNTSLGRFLSIDPLFQDYPFYTPYQFGGNTPIAYIDIDGLEPGKNKRRNRPIVNNKFNGGGVVALFGGMRGKYFRNRTWPGGKPKEPGSSEEARTRKPKDDTEKPKSETETKTVTIEVENPLDVENERDDRLPAGENIVVKKVEPKHKKGKLIIDATDRTDDNSGSIRVEVIGRDGGTVDSQDYTFSTDSKDKDDTGTYDFDLQKGEYIRIVYQGTTSTTSSTTEKTKTTKTTRVPKGESDSKEGAD